MRIGSFELTDRVFAAPMAGVTDRPFRKLCRRLGAAYAVSEMVASDPRVRASGKTSRRLDHDGEASPVAVQLVGADPAILADAARYNVERGAVRIPVVANGDVDSPRKARYVFDVTGVDAIMIGRAAQGRPWLFLEISEYLRTGSVQPEPTVEEVRGLLLEHLDEHYQFYGEA